MDSDRMEGAFTHGASAYTNYGHRCDVCRAGHARQMREYRQRLAERRRLIQATGRTPVIEGITHGEAGYGTFGCRCDTCCKAKLAANDVYLQRKQRRQQEP